MMKFLRLLFVLAALRVSAGQSHDDLELFRDFELRAYTNAAVVTAASLTTNGGYYATTGSFYFAVQGTNSLGRVDASTPSNVTLTATGGIVTIQWRPLPGMSGYRLWRGGATNALTNYITVAGSITQHVDVGTNSWSTATGPSNTITWRPRASLWPGYVASNAHDIATKADIVGGVVTAGQWNSQIVQQGPATGHMDGAMFTSTNWTRLNAETVQLGGLAYAVTGFVVVAGVIGDGATNYNGQYDFATTNFASTNGSFINWVEYDNGENIRTNWFITWNGSSGFFATNFPTGWETAGEVSETFGTADYLRTNSAALTLTAANVATGDAWLASVAGASNLAQTALGVATAALPKAGGSLAGPVTGTTIQAATLVASSVIRGPSLQLSNSVALAVTRYVADENGTLLEAWRAGTNYFWMAMQPTNFTGMRIGGPEIYTPDFTNWTFWLEGTNVRSRGAFFGDGSQLAGIVAGSASPSLAVNWGMSFEGSPNGGWARSFPAGVDDVSAGSRYQAFIFNSSTTVISNRLCAQLWPPTTQAVLRLVVNQAGGTALLHLTNSLSTVTVTQPVSAAGTVYSVTGTLSAGTSGEMWVEFRGSTTNAVNPVRVGLAVP